MKKPENDRTIISYPDYTGPGIYMIKNIVNGKVYIGSSKNIMQRIRMHETAFSRAYCNRKIKEDVLKGHKFIAEIIEKCGDITRYDLRRKEKYYVNIYGSLTSGYNVEKITTYDIECIEKDNKKSYSWLMEKM